MMPLVMLTGGPAGYWHALADQGNEDLTNIVMLWTTHTLQQRGEARAYLRFCRPLGCACSRRRGARVRARGTWRAVAAETRSVGASRRRVRTVSDLRSRVSGNDHDAVRVAARGAGRLPRRIGCGAGRPHGCRCGRRSGRRLRHARGWNLRCRLRQPARSSVPPDRRDEKRVVDRTIRTGRAERSGYWRACPCDASAARLRPAASHGMVRDAGDRSARLPAPAET